MQIWHKFGLIQTIVKKSLLFTGPFGLNLYLNGSIFLDRSPQGREVLNQAVRKAKERGASIWIYPEGTRNSRKALSFLLFSSLGYLMTSL